MSTARFILARYTTSATTTPSPALNASLKMMPRRKISPPLLLSRYRAKADFTPPLPAFMQRLRALCDQHGIMLIADEVQSGAGRTGTLFAMEQMGRCGRYNHVCEIDRRRLSAGRRYRPGRRDGRYRAGRSGRHLCRKPDCLRRRAGGTGHFRAGKSTAKGKYAWQHAARWP
ncbi:4-aminobutyrate aminotransferase [Salmonella enterica subsp. enterica]|uniref:4-aminobutyrate aminotransferase n=1 Tax=Salmonella enterica I TaxID=59201 RepID=A0A447N571_SALET|nr:4-aminobutyrate aminotransferase [Salmonella enterica subsp. enterica]